jgi:hypothetical protein
MRLSINPSIFVNKNRFADMFGDFHGSFKLLRVRHFKQPAAARTSQPTIQTLNIKFHLPMTVGTLGQNMHISFFSVST